jgi:hypothetical protein
MRGKHFFEFGFARAYAPRIRPDIEPANFFSATCDFFAGFPERKKDSCITKETVCFS